ncbi:hypothetical protein [Poriferisphaera sp. WC338]|uniref:hypothetical protein n=1 Tax=Poriferisphaera sp. WC338 TaxID=3425129 RepID=UPI003D818077
MKKQIIQTAALSAFILSSPCLAAPSIQYGVNQTINLLPNAADQEISFFISGITTPAIGLEFDIQVGDGGIDLGGDNTGPVITHIDLISNTIFADGSPTQTDVVTFDLARQSTIDVVSTVLEDGLLATVTFSTVGMDSGSYDLLLSGVAGSFNTDLFDSIGNPLSITAPNGTINVIPEPLAIVFCLLLSPYLLLQRDPIRLKC